MSDKYMTCPNCGTHILATEQSANEIAERVRKEYEYRTMEVKEEFEKRQEKIDKEMEQKLSQERAKIEKEVQEVRQQTDATLAVKYRELKTKYEKRSKQLEQVTKEVTNLRRRQRELEEALEKTEVDLVANLQKEESWEQQVSGYLEGPEFKQHLTSMVDAVFGMKEELNVEKRAIEQLWERQGRQIQDAIEHTAEMYGRFKGIIGSSLLQIEKLDAASDQ